MAILFGKKNSREIFFALALSACLGRYAIAADAAVKNPTNPNSATQPSTEIFDVKTKDIPAPGAPAPASSKNTAGNATGNATGNDIPPPEFKEFGSDPFMDDLLEDPSKPKSAAPAAPKATAVAPINAPVIEPPALPQIGAKKEVEVKPAPVVPVPAASAPAEPAPMVAAPVAEPAIAPAPETAKVPEIDPDIAVPVDSVKTEGATIAAPVAVLTPEDKSKYAELKKHLLNFIANSNKKSLAKAENKVDAETAQNPTEVAATPAKPEDAKPTDDFNDFLEPDGKPAEAPVAAAAPAPVTPVSPAPAPTDPIVDSKAPASPVVAAPVVTPTPVAPVAQAPVVAPVVAVAPKNADVVAPLPPKKLEEEILDKVEVAKPLEREKLSDSDKAYMQLLDKQRAALPEEKRLSQETIAAIEGVSPLLAPVKKGKKDPSYIKLEHGNLGEPLKEEAGVVKSQGKMDISIRNVKKGEDTEKSKVKLERAYKALMVGQNSAAISIYKEVLAKEPKNKDAMFGLATAYHKNNQYEQARGIYTEILKKDPADKEALNNFLVLVAEEAPEDALIELEKLERVNSNFSPIAAQIAMINLRLGNDEKAARYLRRAILLSPENMSYKYNLAVVYDKAGKEEQAAPLYRQVVEAAMAGDVVPGSIDKITDRLHYLEKRIAEKKQ